MFQSNEEKDCFYMDKALVLAQKAYDAGEVPIGALIVSDSDEIIGTGYNQIETMTSQISHAEISAIILATKYFDDWRLEECTLYVTIEPCTMCYGALQLSRIKRLVFGAASPVFGYHLDKDSFLSVYNNDTLLIKRGVREQACAQIVKKFFEQKRVS